MSRSAVWASHLTQAWMRKGGAAFALLPLSGLFWLLLGLRRIAWAMSWKQSVRLRVPVVVVGNRIVGGAGKTPTVMATIRHLQRRGHRVGVLSRGYGGTLDPRAVLAVTPDTQARTVGDEPALIASLCGCPVVVGRDRVAAGQALLRTWPGTTAIVADDGLQHWRLHRDVEVVVFDERGAGNGWLLPAGPLREPLHAAPRCSHQIVLYNAGCPTTSLPGWTAARSLAGFVRLADWWAGRPVATNPPELFEPRLGARVLAIAGIAVPSRFFAQLAETGLVFDACALADHQDYADLPWPAERRRVVVTEKDAIKLEPARLATLRPDCDVWVARLDFRPESGFFDALDAALAAVPSLA